MNFDLITRYGGKDSLIVNMVVDCTGQEIDESEVLDLKELKVLKTQLEDARELIEANIKEFERIKLEG